MVQVRYVTQVEKGRAFARFTELVDSAEALEDSLLALDVPVVQVEVLDRPALAPAALARRRVPLRDKLFFAEQMSSACRVGMPLADALDLCAKTSQSATLRAVVADLRNRIVEEGIQLSQAMRLYPNAFDPLTLGLVTAGEKAGILDRAFDQSRRLLNRVYHLQSKLRRVSYYPLSVLLVAGVVITILLWRVVPAFEGFYRSFRAPLPLPTQVLIEAGRFLNAYPAALAGIVLLAAYLLWQLPRWFRQVPLCHWLALRLPVVGHLVRLLWQANFARAYLQLSAVSMSLLESLQLLREFSTNFFYRAALARARVAVSNGEKLADALEAESDVFGPLLVRTLRFGEESGSSETALRPLADILDERLDEYVALLSSTLEPLLIVVLGVVVGLVFVSIALPMFNLVNVIKG